MPGGFEAGLESLANFSENTNVSKDEARFEAGLHATKYVFQHDVARFKADLEAALRQASFFLPRPCLSPGRLPTF